MDLEQLLALLGCANVAEAATLIARMNAFLADAKASTGKAASADALEAMRARDSFAKSVEAAVGACGAAALGKIEALKEASASVAALEADAKAARKAVDDRDAKELIDQATAAGKIKPAAREKAEGFYAKHGLDGLRSFVESLPEGSGAPSQVELRQVVPGAGGVTLSAEDRALAKALGKSEKDLAESHKHWAESKGELSMVDIAELNRSAPRLSRETRAAS